MASSATARTVFGLAWLCTSATRWRPSVPSISSASVSAGSPPSWNETSRTDPRTASTIPGDRLRSCTTSSPQSKRGARRDLRGSGVPDRGARSSFASSRRCAENACLRRQRRPGVTIAFGLGCGYGSRRNVCTPRGHARSSRNLRHLDGQRFSRATGLAHDVLRQAKAHPLDPFFRPRSVAVIGATETPRSVGRTLLHNLIASPFGGTVYPVNPKRDSVLGIKAYRSIADVPGEVDLAVVVTPAATVPTGGRAVRRSGVPAAVIISAGFHETGRAGSRAGEEGSGRRPGGDECASSGPTASAS